VTADRTAAFPIGSGVSAGGSGRHIPSTVVGTRSAGTGSTLPNGGGSRAIPACSQDPPVRRWTWPCRDRRRGCRPPLGRHVRRVPRRSPTFVGFRVDHGRRTTPSVQPSVEPGDRVARGGPFGSGPRGDPGPFERSDASGTDRSTEESVPYSVRPKDA